jgi:hypothetical protein
MGILNTAAANAAKRAIERALPDRCAVTRVTRAVDAATGGWTDSDATYATGIPARLDKSGLSPRERAIAEVRGSVQTFNLMLSVHPSRWPGGMPDTRSGDRFVLTGDSAGVYEATEDGGPVSDELAREIVVVRVS